MIRIASNYLISFSRSNPYPDLISMVVVPWSMNLRMCYMLESTNSSKVEFFVCSTLLKMSPPN